ncbi:MAG: hypothetical protein CNLJKLNK_00576 [Holosporales bacterium]
MNKFFILAILGSFALPLIAEDAAPKARVQKSKKHKKTKIHHEHLYCDGSGVIVKPILNAVHKNADAAAAAAVSAQETQTQAPKGYIAVSENTFVGMHGFVKAVFNTDFNGFGGDKLQTNQIPFTAPTDKRKFTVQAKATRLGFDALTKTQSGDVKGKIEVDFWGDPAKAGTDDASSSYKLRVRHAFASFNGFTVGQTDSLFVTYPMTPVVDTEGHFGGPLRQLQIRYQCDGCGPISFGVALERPALDMVSDSGAITTSGSAITTSGSRPAGIQRVTRLPDLTAKIGFKFGDHAIGLRTLLRKLEVRDITNKKTLSKCGWGIGADAKLSTMKDSYFVGVVNYGAGIGRYVNELDGLSLAIKRDIITNAISLDTPKMFEWGMGYTQAIVEEVKLNFAYSQVNYQKSSLLSDMATQSVTGKLQRFFTNVMWSPIKDLTLSVEYAQGQRYSLKNATGVQKLGIVRRAIVGVQYNF